MDTKITLSFDEAVINKAKQYAERQNISLSRLMELILDKITSNNYQSLEDLPIASWVHEVSEGKTTYNNKTKSRAKLKKEHNERKK
jgi:hypothetical protein